MSDELKMPASIGARADDGETSLTDPALVRLYESLKGLDRAIHDTLRTLDVALGREPTNGPPKALPFRELGRLRQQLDAAAGRRPESPRLSLGAIAAETADREDSDSDDPVAGGVPAED